MTEGKYYTVKPMNEKPAYEPGYPKSRPCLGYCGKDFLSEHSTHRMCQSCKRSPDYHIESGSTGKRKGAAGGA